MARIFSAPAAAGALVLAAALAPPSPALANTFTLDLTAAGTSRWFDYFSNAFAQISFGSGAAGDADGFYDIDDPSVQYGSFDVFPNEADFSGFGTITHASGTGVGTETVSITGATLNPLAFIDAQSALGGPTVTLGAASGTVRLVNGVATKVKARVPVTFTYDGSAFGIGPLRYKGNFRTANNGTFSLLVDQTRATPFGDARLRWDVTGNIAGFSAAGEAFAPAAVSAVPEPGTWLLLLAGVGAVLLAATRRRSGAES
jgi:hypothetical protein